MKEHEQRLAKYLLMCAIIGEPIGEEEYQTLRDINNCMHSVKFRLPLGAGNIDTDIERSNITNPLSPSDCRSYSIRKSLLNARDKYQKTIETLLQESFQDFETYIVGASLSAVQQAGNCSEYSGVTFFSLIPLILVPYPDITSVSMVISEEDQHPLGSHGWVEISTIKNKTIIADTWAKKSCPIKKEHFKYSKTSESLYANKDIGEEIYHRFNRILAAINNDSKIISLLEKKTKEGREQKTSPSTRLSDHVYSEEETYILSENFKRNFKESSSRIKESKLPLVQILATKIARNMGNNVSEATRWANHVCAENKGDLTISIYD